MEERIKKYLNELFAGRPINSAVIAERQRIKTLLTEKTAELKEQGLDDDEAFSLAVQSLDLRTLNESAETEKKRAKHQPDSVDRFLLSVIYSKPFPYLLVGLCSLIYFIFAGVYGLWLTLLPLVFISGYAVYLLIVIKRLIYYKQHKVYRFVPSAVTGIFGGLVFNIYYFVFLSEGFSQGYILSLPLLPVSIAFVYHIAYKKANKKAPLIPGLIIILFIGLEIYLALRMFLPELKLSWLIPCAAAVIDILLIAGNAGKR